MQKLFARKATGIVREASSLQATIWNIANIMGSKFPWSVARLGLFPAVLILGWPPYLWGVLLFGTASYVLGVIYIQITTPMPRSGADYVIPARLMGPFWGWISSWMIVWSFVPFWGWAAWVTVRNMKQLLDILNMAGMRGVSAPWILNPPASVFIGSFTVILGALLCFSRPRRYYKIVAILGILSIFSLILIALAATMVSQPTLAQNMKSLIGTSPNETVTTAVKHGFDLNGGLDFTGVAGMAGLILYGTSGFQFSATISGDLRGNVKRNLTISILGSLTFLMIFSLPFLWFVLSRFNYNFVVAWSYLFWNANSAAPLMLPPINALLAMLAAPNLWPLWLMAGVAGVIGSWLIIPVSMMYVNRLVLAWGVDRMIPESVAEINYKFGQPLKLVAIEGALGVAFFLVTLLGFNPVIYLWWGTLLLFPSFVFPAICALMLPRRRPELAKNVPWRRLLTPLAVLWLIIIIPIYFFAGFIGSVPPLTPGLSLWQYAISTGLTVTVVTILCGGIVYWLVRSYNMKRGIDVNAIFGAIPPE